MLFTIGLSTGIILGKLTFNSSERPLLIEAFIAIIFSSPSGVKCSLLWTKKKSLF